MMHGQTTEQQCNFPAMPDGTGRGGFHARADVEPSCTTMKRQALETNRLSRSNSFGSLGGLINFFSRIGRDEVDSDSSSQCAKLMKKNAYLEQRLVNASSRSKLYHFILLCISTGVILFLSNNYILCLTLPVSASLPFVRKH